jgi:hypothetical protein
MMVHLYTGQQGARSGRGRRLHDAAAQQRVLEGLGVQVSLEVLQDLPPGAWVRFVPEDAPLRIVRPVHHA